MGPTVRELRFTLGLIKKSPLSIIGVAIVLFYIALALLAPVLAPPVGPNPYIMPKERYPDDPSRPMPMSEKHPFGTTDEFYDVYYGVIWGTHTAFRIGLWVVSAVLAIGLTIGIISGYYGGLIDEFMMRVTDITMAFPGLVLAMAFVVALPLGITLNLPLILALVLALALVSSIVSRSSLRLISLLALFFGLTLASALAFPITWAIALSRLDRVLMALVLVGWPGYARLVRGEILRVKHEDYVEAAKAIGASDLRVVLRHILPNMIYPVIVVATLDIGTMVLLAAALSFLGLGAEPGYADWGQIISGARAWIGSNPANPFQYWNLFLLPGIFIFTFSLGWNLLGDAFRDILDPMIRRG